MKKITLLLLAVFALSFSAIAQVKMYLHFSDGTTYETLASLVDSITFDLPSVDPSDPSFPSIPEEDEEINEGENNGNDNNPDLSEIDLPEIDLPSPTQNAHRLPPHSDCSRSMTTRQAF